MRHKSFDIDEFNGDEKLVENALKTALDSNFSSIMLTRADAGYPIVYVNSAFTSLTGYNQDEVIGKGPSILQGPKTDHRLLEQLRDTIDEGNIFFGRTINYRKDGSEFMMEWKVYPIHDSENLTTHYLAVQRAAK